MREILFRGQTRRYGEKVWMDGEKVPSQWVYGGVLQGIGDFSIIYGYDNPELKGEIQKHTVYTDTLGQYTGLQDKNGKRIFEGDVVKYGCDLMVVVWQKDAARFALKFSADGYYSQSISRSSVYLEVIGNIHDDPEMIGGKKYVK